MNLSTLDEHLFGWITDHPRWVFTLMMGAIVLSISPLASMQQDTRADAFLDSNNPALVYRDVVREQFGLDDPFYIAVLCVEDDGIYSPSALGLISELSDKLAALANIEDSRLVSLATEKNIVGSVDGLTVSPFIEEDTLSQEEADTIRAQIADFPLYRDTLIGPSGKASLIVVELIDESLGQETYESILKLIETLDMPAGISVHVAGEGAIAGYLGAYIDTDAKRLNPLAAVIVLLVIMLAFRRVVPGFLALVIVAASVFMSLGSMSAAGIPFYVITNTLPVILVGISVADTIHILGRFFDLQAAEPEVPRKTQVVRALQDMWRPVTATSLTTAAGFMGLYFASDMPPFRYFGLFAALGIMVAWFYSMFFLPAAMVIFKLQIHPSFIDASGLPHSGGAVGFMRKLGDVTLANAKFIIIIFLLLGFGGLYSASHLEADGDRIDLFGLEEPISIADKVINRDLYGTNTLDIVVEASEVEGLLQPESLRRMERLQEYAQGLPNVTGSTSIVDYLKQMNRAMNSGKSDDYVLPESAEMAAQYFLLYSMTSDPSDFEEEIDYDYRLANIRVTLDSGSYRDITPVIESLENYITSEFNTGFITATQSGRVNLNYHWFRNIAESHFTGLGVAILLVYVVAALLYRSLVAGVYALIPVCSSVLCVYAFMVSTGMTLEIGTSMFAAVSIGLGVDFAIHTMDRMRVLYAETEGAFDRMFALFYGSTGRALLFNALAIACGFGVLVFSEVSQLRDFGSVVVLSMCVSFISSMTLAPALFALTRPKFLISDSVGKAV